MGYYDEQEEEKNKKMKLDMEIINNERNKHVLLINERAKLIIDDFISNKYCKQDVILLGEIILDIGKRLD